MTAGVHPAALRGTCAAFNSALVMLSASTAPASNSQFSPEHTGTPRADPGDPGVRPARWSAAPNLLAREKRQTFVRRCIHRAAIVEGGSDQNDNADDCLPTVVSCSCGADPAPLQWVPVSQQPDHKSVTLLTAQAQQSGRGGKKGFPVKNQERVMAVSAY